MKKMVCFRDSMKEQVLQVRHRSDISTKGVSLWPKGGGFHFYCVFLKFVFLSLVWVCLAFLFFLPCFLLDSLHVCLHGSCVSFIFKFLLPAAFWNVGQGSPSIWISIQRFLSFLFLSFIFLVIVLLLLLFSIALNFAGLVFNYGEYLALKINKQCFKKWLSGWSGS